MAFDKDIGAATENAEVQVARDSWVKPEILSFEPVAAAQGTHTANPGDGFSNLS